MIDTMVVRARGSDHFGILCYGHAAPRAGGSQKDVDGTMREQALRAEPCVMTEHRA